MTLFRPGAAGLLVLVIAALTLAAFVGLAETEPTISDPIGYLYAAERLADGRGLTYTDPLNQIAGPYFVLYAFQVSRPGDAVHYLGFPPGFSLLLAPGAALGMVHLVMPVVAALTLIAVYFLGKTLTDNAWVGFWAAVLLLSADAFWRFGAAAWSELPATLALTVGVTLFLKARETKGGLLLSLLAAFVLSFGHFIRYTNVVFLAAPAVYDLYTARQALVSERWRWPFWVAVAVGLAAIPIFNHFYYGGALITSYSPQHGWYPSPPFALAYALGPSFVDGYSLRESLKTLWANFPIALLAAPFGWWLLPRPSRALVAAAVGFGLLPYAIYAFAPTGINSRFLLPIFPFLCVAIGQLIAALLSRLPRPSYRWAVGLALLIGLFLGLPGHWAALEERNAADRAAVALVREWTAEMEPNAVALSYTYNDLIAVYGGRSALNYRRIPRSDAALDRYRVEMLEPCLVGAVDRLLARSVPVYAIEEPHTSSWDAAAILRRHFALAETRSEPTIYRVVNRTSDSQPDESECRFP